MKTSTSTAALLVVLAAVPATAKNFCRATAKGADRACKTEAKADFALTLGRCENAASKDVAKACKRTAKAEFREAKGDCKDVADARKDLCEAVGPAPYDPPIDPPSFLSPAATAAAPNPFFPLKPGNTWTYMGGGETNVVTVTNDTRVIAGVTTIVVHDVVSVGAKTTEDTDDFYAQHTDGTVWYFGEVSRTFDDDGDLVDLEGSFKAGVDGAHPGVIMEAAPAVGDFYRQEFSLGVAEDAGEILDTAGTASSPAASCNGTCLVIRDVNPFDPEADEVKYYAPGIGMILETDKATGERLTELVSYIVN